jgi:cell division protein ZapE
MPSTVTERYAALVGEGEIERDSAQEAVAAKLTRLESRLAQHRLSRKSSHLGWLFGRSDRQEVRSAASTSTATSGAARPC